MSKRIGLGLGESTTYGSPPRRFPQLNDYAVVSRDLDSNRELFAVLLISFKVYLVGASSPEMILW